MIIGLKKLLTDAGLPELGPGPRSGALRLTELNGVLDELLKGCKLPAISQELIRGLVLLWHDHIDAAHEIAQAIENADGSFLHGILHRREPDYGNAAYWFRRAGRYDSLSEMGIRASALLKAKNEMAAEKELIRNGEWNPYGFIKLCEKAARKTEDSRIRLLRELQGMETEVLLEKWCDGASR